MIRPVMWGFIVFLCIASLSSAETVDEDTVGASTPNAADSTSPVRSAATAGEGEKEITLDDLEKPDSSSRPAARASPHRPGHPGGPGGSLKERFAFNLMLDFTMDYFLGEKTDSTRRSSFGSEHEYVILGLSPKPEINVRIELIDLVFWEVSWRLNPLFTVKMGKLAVPFSSMFLHQLYGGIIEKPLADGSARALLVPRDWTEYGVQFDCRLVDAEAFTLKSSLWITNGLSAGLSDINAADRTVTLRTVGMDLNKDKAFGLRLTGSFAGNRVLTGISGYTSKWARDKPQDSWFGDGDRVYIGNVDMMLGYGLVPLFLLRDVRLAGAFALLRNSSTQTPDYLKYWQTASYAEATFRARRWLDMQYRFGTYDDNTAFLSSRDLINHNIALYIRPDPSITLVPRFYFNRERVNEAADDYFLFKVIVQI